MFKMIRAVMLTALGALSVFGADDSGNAALRAYSRMDYAQARKLAAAAPEQVENRLVSALCDIYDRARPDIGRGQQQLERIFQDAAAPLPLRAEAGVALARTAQLMKERPEVYGKAADRYDHIAIFRAAQKLLPDSSFARDAFFYRIREELENRATRDAAFLELETFFTEFKGDAHLLPAVRLVAEYEYIRLRGDYENAVRHLAAGCEQGFSNPNENRGALFRLCFLTDKRLHDRERAIAGYRRFIQKYPFSAQAVVAGRYLKELGVGSENESGR